MMVEKTFVLYYIAREERGVNSSLTSDVGRYIQDLNILAINKPSTIYVFHRTTLCDITAVLRAYLTASLLGVRQRIAINLPF